MFLYFLFCSEKFPKIGDWVELKASVALKKKGARIDKSYKAVVSFMLSYHFIESGMSNGRLLIQISWQSHHSCHKIYLWNNHLEILQIFLTFQVVPPPSDACMEGFFVNFYKKTVTGSYIPENDPPRAINILPNTDEMYEWRLLDIPMTNGRNHYFWIWLFCLLYL